MRTQDKIAEKVRKSRKEFLSFGWEVLVDALDYEHAKEFLKPETKAEEWKQKDETQLQGDMRQYMAEIAWDKAENHRGISAGRSVEKMLAWAWLLSSDETYRELEEFAEHNYRNYGAPILALVCEKFGFPGPNSEALRRMARGEMCSDYCEEGCG